MPFSRSRVYFPNKEMQSHHAEQEDTIHHSMFTKLHQSHTHHFHHQHQHQHQQNHGYISEEDDCRSSGGNNNNNNNGFNTTPQEPTNTNSGGATDGATIEIIRRPRGRPPGSKNKPKPPLLITCDAPECAMRPIFLQLPNGLDIMDSIARFTRKRSIGLTILNATGSVTNVSIRQPNTSSTSPPPPPTVTFHGRFDILSISATFLPPSPPPISSTLTNSLTISLAGPQGQIIGGSVVGSLIAAGSVYIMAASFSNPSYHRLPVEEDDDLSQNDSVGVDSTSHHPPPPAELSMYSAHCVPSDFIWTPATTTTARQPPPY